MNRLIATMIGTLALVGFTSVSSGNFIVYGTHTDHAIVPGASLKDVRMSVDLSVAGGQAIFTFTNVSIGLETSAVFKEIAIDTGDDDMSSVFLWGGTVLTNSPGVSYTIRPSNGLPGYGEWTNHDSYLIEMQADSPPTKKGIGIGESVQVRFFTSLADGSTVEDYLRGFGGGNDTSLAALGFHAISASILNGESLSGATSVPEPTVAGLLALGGTFLAARRRRKMKMIVS